jgi:hypothetical protein
MDKTPKWLNGVYFTPPRQEGKRKGLLKWKADEESIEKFCITLQQMAEWARSTNRKYLKIDLYEGKEGQYGPQIDFTRSEWLSDNEIAGGQGNASGEANTNSQPSGEPTAAKVGWSAKTGWDANG